MDAYLDIAISVLRLFKRPLGPRTILAEAYKSGIIPAHLHGKTQHKTLQARISEDIITQRERSAFFRTEPGRFFLREFITDENIPSEYRQPIATRRRIRDLHRCPALAFDTRLLYEIAAVNSRIEADKIFGLLRANNFRYADPKATNCDSVFLWSFVSVSRINELLCYRLGRYRDNRDSFIFKKTIGFSTLVYHDDRTLFNLSNFGIVDSGVRAAKIDLDVPDELGDADPSEENTALKYFYWISRNPGSSELLAVIDFECPSWFEPIKRRLAINDLHWMNLNQPINNIDDFDPWSKSVLAERIKNEMSISAQIR